MSDTEESTNSNYNNEEEIKLNEIYFDKLLEENKNRPTSDDSLVHDVNVAFRRLLDLYLYANQYEKLYSLINRIASDNSIRYKDELCRIVGDLFYENEFPINSLMYYRQSIGLNPFNLLSIESFENLLNSFIERWHYRMINDQTRNYAYSKAIYKKLNSMAVNPRVLEIGFGCGVLTAQCLQARQSTVYACEQNEIFFQIAERFLKANQLNSSNPILINKHSKDLSIQNDFNGRQVDVIVTEIFDDGLLGEDCLETFYDALFKTKIIKPSSTHQRFNIIPKYACIHICAIESKTIRNMSYFNIKHGNHDIKVISNADPYTTENINKVQFKLLTEPIEIDKFKIEFDDFELLRNLCEFKTVLKTHSKLKFIQSGLVDAYVVWFDLFLDDEISITNSPFNQSTETRAKCWHQAVYPTHDYVGYIEINSSLVVEISLKKDCILINKLQCESDDANNGLEIQATAAEVTSLNDSKYEDYYLNCLNEILNGNQERPVRIGLYSKSVNIIILEFLVGKYEACDIQLVWFSDCQNDTFNEFMKNQKITKSIHIIEIDSILNNNNNTFKIDYLIYEPLDLNLGVLRKNLFSNILLIRDSLLKNKNNIFPTILSLSGMYIECGELLNEATLTKNENLHLNTESLDLKKILEDYRISHQFAVNRTQFDNFKGITEPLKLFEIDFRKSDLTNEFQRKTIEFDVKNSGKITIFLYWHDFEAIINENKRISFNSYCSFNDFNFNLAGIMEYNQYEVKKENMNKIKAQALLKQDIFYIKVETI